MRYIRQGLRFDRVNLLDLTCCDLVLVFFRSTKSTLPGQVLRDTRLRLAAPGTTPTVEESQNFRDTTTKFLQRRIAAAKAAPAAKAKAKARAAKVPRLAALDWLMATENAMQSVSTGMSWNTFLPEEKKWDEDLVAQEKLPSLLVLTMDQCQVQRCGCYYVLNRLQGSVMMLFGPFHRRHNDVQRGLTQGGLYGAVLRMVICCNVAYGPWQGAGNFEQLSEVACEAVAHMSPDDAFLMTFWHQVCRDHGWVEPQETDSDARQKFLDNQATSRSVTAKGPKASVSRWLSVKTAIKWQDKEVHTKAFLLALLSCLNGWAPSFEALRGKSSNRPVAVAVESASSFSAGPAAPVAAASAAKIKQDVAHERSKMAKNSVNSLHMVAKYLLDPDLITASRIVLMVTTTFAEEHSEWAKNHGSPESSVQYYSDSAVLQRQCNLGAVVCELHTVGALPQQLPGAGQGRV